MVWSPGRDGAIIAQRFNAGWTLPQWLTVPAGTAEPLSKHEARIILQVVLFQKGDQLLLIALRSMVLFLIANVFQGDFLLRYADAERSIPFLPLERPVFGKRVMDPLGRSALDELNCLCQSESRR